MLMLMLVLILVFILNGSEDNTVVEKINLRNDNEYDLNLKKDDEYDLNLRKDDEYNLNLKKDDESAAFVFNAIANARPPLLSPIKY